MLKDPTTPDFYTPEPFSPDLSTRGAAHVHPWNEEEEYEEVRSLYAVMHGQSPQKKLFDPKTDRVPMDKSSLPCYQHFMDKEQHTGPCEFSHNPALMHAYRDKLLERLVGSPWVDPEWLKASVDKLYERVTKRPASAGQKSGGAPVGKPPGKYHPSSVYSAQADGPAPDDLAAPTDPSAPSEPV